MVADPIARAAMVTGSISAEECTQNMAKSSGDRLHPYRAKRRAGTTPEPFGGAGAARPRLFVVQKHSARSLHYDFRLEWNGVLLSWAVPKGPCRDPKTKRLAMQTEDHPVEYADFEGVIPEGNYGAGEVIVWDVGSWVPLLDPAEGLQRGKLLFELRGHKLRGVWTIFRTKKKDEPQGRQWLLVKKPDVWAEEGGWEPWPETSVLSGLTVEELKKGSRRAGEIRKELQRLGAKKRPVDPERVKLMLARTEPRPFSSPDWIYELKYDGFRLLAAARDGEAKLLYRSGRDATRLYPEVARTVAALPTRSLILDGEIVVLDEQVRPDFQQLQQRGQLTRPAEIARASVQSPIVCYVFDLLAFEDHDLRGLPLVRRKELLRRVLPPAGTLRFADHVEAEGEALFDQVRRRGLEGIIAKRADSRYCGGRSGSWLKLKADRTGDFVVAGFTAPRGSRAGLGALHLAAYQGGELVYTGRVGTGFSDRRLVELRARLEPLGHESPPCTGPVPRTRGHHWVRLALVCEVRYQERTADGLLRQPSFLRLRDDKEPGECEAPEARGAGGGAPAAPPDPAAPAGFVGTNLDKVFWPAEGYTKGDLVDFYRAAGPWLLPYLRDRPVVLTRHP
ncbi:MAG: non-homologous end-joining DNA ligase, partial [Planctomycetota bacterium]